MAAAAKEMAAGRWGVRVSDTSADEVGELARAFNAMAGELAAVDRMRKDLIANVSHELRTPISALQARRSSVLYWL
jgi:signal transduction histidine kinase